MNRVLRYTLVMTVAAALALPVAAVAQGAHEFNAEGVALYNAGRYNDAIRSFEKAYDLARDNTTVRRNLCNAHQAAANAVAKTADFARAAQHLELAIAIDAENASPLVQLASYYLRLDMVYEAIARLEEAIEIEPRNVTAHDLLGDAYYMDNDIQNARVQWEWVATQEPNRTGLQKKLEKAGREAAVEADYRPSGSRHFQLTFDPQMPGRMLRRVLTTLERAYVEVGRNFGNVFPPSPVQVIAYNQQDFANATLVGNHVGGIYDGKIRIPLNDEKGALLDDATLEERLFHEYTHVVVRFLTGDNVPWWLNEGAAETFSKPMTPDRAALLQRAIAEDILFPLAAIDANQLNLLDPASLQLAYAQSHATVHYLWSRFGQGRLANMLSALAAGKSPEDALFESYNRTYDSLLKEVKRQYADGQPPR